MTPLKEKLISFVKTFLATFLSIFGTLLMTVPTDVLFNLENWKTGVLAGLIVGLVRSALSETWKKTMPISLGGVPKNDVWKR